MGARASACESAQAFAWVAPVRHSWVETRLAALARRTWLVIALAGLIPLAGRAVLLPVFGVPKPAIQDEFAYLLGADTFARGRLTNPTPPLAEHFETLQEIFHPTYASKYPPFSSLMMAFGQRFFGEPWIGVWLSMGLLCASLCWALQGWLPPVWALAGTSVAIVRIGIVSYWTETYWGGTCAALGGALVIGAVPRLIRRPRAMTAVVLAAGLAVLANTRPYEGSLLAVVSLGYLAWALARRGFRVGRVSRSIVLPAALVLAPVVVWMGYYNYRVTGNALELPYVAHEKQYNVWSSWLWSGRHAGPAPAYANSTVRDYWLNAFGAENEFARSHLLKTHVSDVLSMADFFLGWPIVLCMIACAVPLWREPQSRCVLLLGVLFYAGCAMVVRVFPHYAAPGTVLVYILAGLALRAAWRIAPGSLAERRFLAAGVLALFVVTTLAGWQTPKNRYYFSATDYHVKAKRARAEQRLLDEPGEHLVLVHYGLHHDLWEELVYNNADIDESRIVWAHSLGREKDGELMRYYGKRDVWELEEDGRVQLKRYIPSTERTTLTPLGRGVR